MPTLTEMIERHVPAVFQEMVVTGKVDAETLWSIKRSIEGALGCYPVASACRDDVLRAAAHYWSNSAEELATIADNAAQYVADNWEGVLDETDSEAIEYIEENAEAAGIELKPIPPTTTTTVVEQH